MGPALEVFLLFVLTLGVAAAVAVYFTRPLWRRAARKIVEADREELEMLEARARERAEEADARRRAEDELHRALSGLDIPGASHPHEAPRRREPEKP